MLHNFQRTQFIHADRTVSYTLLVMPHRYTSSLGCVTDTWASTALSLLQNNIGLNPNDFTFKCVCVHPCVKSQESWPLLMPT